MLGSPSVGDPGRYREEFACRPRPLVPTGEPLDGERRVRSLVGRFVLAGVIVIGFLLLIPVVFRAREEARMVELINHLKQIGLAVHNYQGTYECIPPAYQFGPSDAPWVSWRYIAMPFMESIKFYGDYNFNLPWNTAENLTISGMPMLFYARPGPDGTRSTRAELLAVVGPQTAMTGPVGVRLDQIRDGQSNTLLVGEVAESTVRWTEPRDLRFDAMDFRVNGLPKTNALGSPYGGARVLMVDGSVRTLPNATHPSLVRALLTIDGGEAVPGWDEVR